MIRRVLRSLVAGLAVVLGCSLSLATVRQTIVLSAVDSNGTLDSPANSVRTAVVAGGYSLGRLAFSGSVTSLAPATQLIDSRVLITAPNGAQLTFQPFATGGIFTTRTFNISLFMDTVADPVGTWSFRFYELVDNGGTAQVDARWNFSMSLTDEVPVAPASTDLGTITSAGLTRSSSLAANQVLWYRFSLGCSNLADLGTYFDLDTFGSTLVGTLSPNDLQLALYDSAGMLVAIDDDAGPGFTPQLSFGAGTRPPIQDGDPFAGSNGALRHGVYYMALGAYPMNVLPSRWGASANSTATGTIALRVRTNVGVGVPPSIAQQPTGLSIRAGTTANFLVSLQTGSSGVSYQWRRNGAPLQDDDRIIGSATDHLSIRSTSLNDAGTYDVVVRNPCSITASASAPLAVSCPADFDDGSGTGTPDGGVTIDDLLYYLVLYAQGTSPADLDDGSGTGTPDGGVTIDDLLYYLVRYELGC